MKLGIYGDSFACGHHSSIETHWYYVLAKMLDASYYTYGQSSTSTFYSYKIFLEEYKKFDINIFLITHAGRYTQRIFLESQPSKPHWVSSINQVDHLLNTVKDLTKHDITQLEDVKSWFKVSDWEFSKSSQELMVSEIKRRCPNVILIPCFSEDYSLSKDMRESLNILENGSCWDFLTAQFKWFGKPPHSGLAERKEKVACHFTPETNELFAASVFDLLKNDVSIQSPEIIQHKYDLHYYFEE